MWPCTHRERTQTTNETTIFSSSFSQVCLSVTRIERVWQCVFGGVCLRILLLRHVMTHEERSKMSKRSVLRFADANFFYYLLWSYAVFLLLFSCCSSSFIIFFAPFLLSVSIEVWYVQRRNSALPLNRIEQIIKCDVRISPIVYVYINVQCAMWNKIK